QPAEVLDLRAVADVGPRGRARQPDAHGFDAEGLVGGSGHGTVTDRGLPADVLYVSLVADAARGSRRLLERDLERLNAQRLTHRPREGVEARAAQPVPLPGHPGVVLHVSLVRDAEAEGDLRAVAGPAPVRAGSVCVWAGKCTCPFTFQSASESAPWNV